MENKEGPSSSKPKPVIDKDNKVPSKTNVGIEKNNLGEKKVPAKSEKEKERKVPEENKVPVKSDKETAKKAPVDKQIIPETTIKKSDSLTSAKKPSPDNKAAPSKELNRKSTAKQKDTSPKPEIRRHRRSYLERPRDFTPRIRTPLPEGAEIISDSDEPVSHLKLEAPEPEIKEEPEIEDHNLLNIIAGGTSSIATILASHPLVVLKERYQLEQFPKKSSPNIRTFIKNMRAAYHTIIFDAKILYVDKGLKAFYKDHTANQVVSFVQTITLFLIFDMIRSQLDHSPIAQSHKMCNFTAGFLSGGAAAVVAHPFQKIARRITARNIVEKRFVSVRTAHLFFREHGLQSFYRGISPTLLHLCPLYGFKFMFYNVFCDYVLDSAVYHEREEIPALSLISAGAASGISSNMLVFPLDLIRQRIQSHTLDKQRYKFDATCRRIGQCVVLVVRREGFFGLYKGILPCLMKSTVSTAIQFSMFDKVHRWAQNTFKHFDFEKMLPGMS